MKFYPKDIIALVTILGFLALLAKGFNGWVQTAFLMVLMYYFVRRDNINGKK